MVKTTKDVIKVLPFDEDFKLRLLSAYDHIRPEPKSLLIDLLWDAYDAMYEIKLEENMDEELRQAFEGKTALDQNLYSKARDKTEKDMDEEATGQAEKIDLSTTRASLEKILSESPSNKN